jgi:ergothioneine biosynthesis protein EgtB
MPPPMTRDLDTARGPAAPTPQRAEGRPPALAERYRAIRSFSEDLCAPLAVEDYGVQSMPDASPAKWHLAHTSWFFETFVLKRAVSDYRAFHPQYEGLFNSYYNSVGEQFPRPRRGLLSRPTVEDTYGYRRHVDREMMVLLADSRRVAAIGTAAAIELGLQHEQQHQELILTDLKHLFSCNPLRPAYRSAAVTPAGAVTPCEWIAFSGGLHQVGAQGDGFAFDNERPSHRVFLEPFMLASRLVTNGEFLHFIEDGGYRQPEWWLSDGWDMVRAQSWQAPLYWEKHQTRWMLFSLAGMGPVDAAEPVCHVSYYEADAYARWARARLPREAEWEVAAATAPIAGNFAETGRCHPAALATAASRCAQLFGDVWEWTQSPYTPYPGYRQPEGAFGEYNAKFMSSQMVLRGGSCASPQLHLRATYRNFFPPSARWQFMGLRLARDAD